MTAINTSTLLRQKFPETGSDVLNNYVNENEFAVAKAEAISLKKDFSFETNFNADDPMETFRQFKGEGYQTKMIFIGMENIEDCIQRVSIRIKKGGHKVSESDIRNNYVIGLKNLNLHFKSFDHVVIMDNSIPKSNQTEIPKVILEWTRGGLDFFDNTVPRWFEGILNNLKLS